MMLQVLDHQKTRKEHLKTTVHDMKSGFGGFWQSARGKMMMEGMKMAEKKYLQRNFPSVPFFLNTLEKVELFPSLLGGTGMTDSVTCCLMMFPDHSDRDSDEDHEEASVKAAVHGVYKNCEEKFKNQNNKPGSKNLLPLFEGSKKDLTSTPQHVCKLVSELQKKCRYSAPKGCNCQTPNAIQSYGKKFTSAISSWIPSMPTWSGWGSSASTPSSTPTPAANSNSEGECVAPMAVPGISAPTPECVRFCSGHWCQPSIDSPALPGQGIPCDLNYTRFFDENTGFSDQFIGELEEQVSDPEAASGLIKNRFNDTLMVKKLWHKVSLLPSPGHQKGLTEASQRFCGLHVDDVKKHLQQNEPHQSRPEINLQMGIVSGKSLQSLAIWEANEHNPHATEYYQQALQRACHPVPKTGTFVTLVQSLLIGEIVYGPGTVFYILQGIDECAEQNAKDVELRGKVLYQLIINEEGTVVEMKDQTVSLPIWAVVDVGRVLVFVFVFFVRFFYG